MQSYQDIVFQVNDWVEHAYFRVFPDNPELDPYLDFIPWPIKVSSIIFSDGTQQSTAGGGGGGSQTPWLSDIDAAGNYLFNLSGINGAPGFSISGLSTITAGSGPISISANFGLSIYGPVQSYGGFTSYGNITTTTCYYIGSVEFACSDGAGGIDLTNIATINGAAPGGGGSQTPWLSNIDGGGFNLSNVSGFTLEGGVQGGFSSWAFTLAPGSGDLYVSPTGTANNGIFHLAKAGNANGGRLVAEGNIDSYGCYLILGVPFACSDGAGGIDLSNISTINGAAPGGGGSQTPWLSNIDAAGYQLNGASFINITNYSSAPSLQLVGVGGPYLDFVGDTRRWLISAGGGTPGGMSFVDFASSSYRMVIVPAGGSGCVGINQTGASYALDVSGDININDPGGVNGYAFRINGVPLASVLQTPWLSDIDAAGYSLLGVTTIGGPPGGGGVYPTIVMSPNMTLTAAPGWFVKVITRGVAIGAVDLNPSYQLDVGGDINITDPGGANGYAFRINGVPFAFYDSVTGGIDLTNITLLNGSPPGSGGGGGAVDAVFGRSGVVVAQAGDYNATLITLAPQLGSWTTVQAAIAGLDADISSIVSSQWIDGAAGAIYYNGGSVGIGTATPDAPLMVLRPNMPGGFGTVHFKSTTAAGGSNSNISLALDTTDGGTGVFCGIDLYQAGVWVGEIGYVNGRMNFWTQNASQPVLCLLDPDLVGINTASPVDSLTINSLPPSTGQLRFVNPANGVYSAFVRCDGSTFYLMKTAANDPYGSWTSPFPIQVDLETSDMIVGGNFKALGAVSAGVYGNPGSQAGDITLSRNNQPTVGIIWFGSDAYMGFDGSNWVFNPTLPSTGGGITVQSDATSVRAMNTTYQNTVGKWMHVNVTLMTPAGSFGWIYSDAGNPPSAVVGRFAGIAGFNLYASITFVVLAGNYYQVFDQNNVTTILSWIEYW